jgi:hypothetical protein
LLAEADDDTKALRLDCDRVLHDYARDMGYVFALRAHEFCESADSLASDHFDFYGLRSGRLLDVIPNCSPRKAFVSPRSCAPLNSKLVLVVLL